MTEGDQATLERIQLHVNGVVYELDVEPRWLLSDVLRNKLELTGTHVGCEHGVCGACTILVDNEPIRSCLMFAVQADGRQVRTVEGLANGDELHPLQEAFREHHGLQCGFCTPGFLLSSLSVYRDADQLSDAELREELGGQICRCTGYVGIVAAVRAAGAIEKERAGEA
jgi:carbon-monoxide dehydrogenase small subunit